MSGYSIEGFLGSETILCDVIIVDTRYYASIKTLRETLR